MDSDNPWHERLRSIQYDRQEQAWLLYTSEGFFTATTLTKPARKIPLVPPLSIMGINVLEPLEDGQWLVGSFSGLFQWDRERGDVTDLNTGKAPLRRVALRLEDPQKMRFPHEVSSTFDILSR